MTSESEIGAASRTAWCISFPSSDIALTVLSLHARATRLSLYSTSTVRSTDVTTMSLMTSSQMKKYLSAILLFFDA